MSISQDLKGLQVDRWSTLHDVFADSSPRRHCTLQNVYACRILYMYMYVWIKTVFYIYRWSYRGAIGSVLPLNLCVQHLDDVWTFLAANAVNWTLLWCWRLKSCTSCFEDSNFCRILSSPTGKFCFEYFVGWFSKFHKKGSRYKLQIDLLPQAKSQVFEPEIVHLPSWTC